MAENAAERVALVGEVLAAQVRVLWAIVSAGDPLTSRAQAKTSSTALGVMNTFLAPKLNRFAGRAAR